MEYIAPTALSWITCFYAMKYDKTRIDLTYRIIKMAVTYFLGDSIYIITKHKTEYYAYIVHHLLAMYVGICGYLGYINPHILSLYFITFEFSNLFLNIWGFTKKRFPKIKNIPFALTVITYVPTRTVVLPIITRKIFMDSKNKGYYELCLIYCMLYMISFWYSFIILKIASKKLNIIH